MAGTALQTLTVTAAVTQSTAATQDNHLVRLAEARALLAALFQGAWSGATTYSSGQIVSNGGAIFVSKQNTNLNHATSDTAWWTSVLVKGADGASAYIYTAYASASDGTGFNLTPSDSLPYLAVKLSTTVIGSPQASDFAGLWRNCAGPTGAAGADGTAGTAGVSAYVYIRYASDTSGTGLSSTPGSGLGYVAIKATTSPIVSPVASDFTGLWKLYAVPALAAGILKSDGTTVSGAAKTDDLPEASSPTNLWFTVARVLASALTGLSTATGGDVTATDTILVALGKVQKRLKDVETGTGVDTAEGTIALAAVVGVYPQTGTVTGLALAFTPARVQLTMEIPNTNGAAIFPVLVGDVTTDGFAWALSAAPAADGYKIHYRIS
jgi:hypothetical protein